MVEKIDERVYTIPLRREWIKYPRGRRVNRSVNVVRSFIRKHTKAEDVKLSVGINEYLWMSGIQKPPGKVKVTVRLEEGKAFARLPEEKPPEPEKKTKKVKEKSPEAPEKKDEKPTAAPKETPAKKEEIAAPKETKKQTAEEEAEQLWKEAEKKIKEEKH